MAKTPSTSSSIQNAFNDAQSLPALVNAFGAALGNITEDLEKLAGTAGAAAKSAAVAQVSGSSANVGRALAGAAGDPAALLDAFAASLGNVTAGIQELVGTVAQFVQALAPSVMLEFSNAIQSLQATIGVAFAPFVQVISSVTREIAGVLLPVMQRLAPLMRTLGEIIGNELVSAAKLLALVFEALTPLLEVVADLEQEYSKFLLDLVSLVTAFARTIKDVVSAFFGGGFDFKDTFKGFFDVIRQVTKALVTLVATLAVFAGLRDTVGLFADKLAKEAKDRAERPGGALAAGTNPTITDIAALVRQQQLAAFTAQGGDAAREKTDTEWLRDIATALKDTASTRKSFQEALSAWWNEQVMLGESSLLKRVLKFFDGISGGIQKAVARIGGGLF